MPYEGKRRKCSHALIYVYVLHSHRNTLLIQILEVVPSPPSPLAAAAAAARRTILTYIVSKCTYYYIKYLGTLGFRQYLLKESKTGQEVTWPCLTLLFCSILSSASDRARQVWTKFWNKIHYVGSTFDNLQTIDSL